MLEVKIEELTRVIEDLIHTLRTTGNAESVNLVDHLDSVGSVPVVMTYTPEDQAVAKVAVEVLKSAMPPAPVFESVATPAANAAPFTDGKGLIDYVMTVYKELGAEKGAKIQGVLTEMGLQNVNDLRPTEYDAFYAKVEALKA